MASSPKIWSRPRTRPRASGLGLETFWPMLLLSQQLNGEGHHRLATTARYCSFLSQAPMNSPNNFCATLPTSTPTLSTTLRLNWQNSMATFQCCSLCLIDCFASRQALLQSREFSRRAVLMLCLSHWFS